VGRTKERKGAKRGEKGKKVRKGAKRGEKEQKGNEKDLHPPAAHGPYEPLVEYP